MWLYDVVVFVCRKWARAGVSRVSCDYWHVLCVPLCRDIAVYALSVVVFSFPVCLGLWVLCFVLGRPSGLPRAHHPLNDRRLSATIL